MKFFAIVLTLFAFCRIPTVAQNYRTTTRLIQVIESRTHQLNGKLRSDVAGGMDRIVIPVNLPANTKSWYYIFSTSKTGTSSGNLNLLSQLSGLVDQTGLSALALSAIKIPAGTVGVNIYELDGANQQYFYSRQRFANYPGGTILNASQGKMNVPARWGQIYLGIENTSTLDGVAVTIEAVAVVEERIRIEPAPEVAQEEESPAPAGNRTEIPMRPFWEKCMVFLYPYGSVEVRKSTCDCMVKKLQSGYSEKDLLARPFVDAWPVAQSMLQVCSFEQGKMSDFVKADSNQKLFAELESASTFKDYKKQEEIFEAMIRLGSQPAMTFSNMAFVKLCLGKAQESRPFLEKGLKLEPDNLYLKGNLANYFLLTGDVDEALKIYKKHRKQELPDKRKFWKAVDEDLKEFERLGLSNPGFEKVRYELRLKANSLLNLIDN